MELKEILTNYRKENDLSQREFARRCGLSNSLISILEMGKNPQTKKKMAPDLDTYRKLANAMGISVQKLFEMLGNSERVDISMPREVIPIDQLHRQSVRLIGAVAAGEPILADEEYDIYIDAPAKADYALRVQGDSMEPTYLDGDVIYIHQQDDVDDGTVGVVLCEDSACLKHIYHIDNGLQLVSDNPKYPPMIKTWPEYDPIRILGKVVGYTRMFK